MYMSRSLHDFRFPASLAVALLPTAALFWCLWSLTKVDAPLPPIKGYIFEPGPQRKDSPLITKTPTVLDIPPPPITHELPKVPIPDRSRDRPVIQKVPRYVAPGPDIGKRRVPVAMNSEATPQIRVPPEYPPRAVAQGLEGWVKVQFTITASGSVKDAKVVESSAPIFEKAAINAILRWRYNPMMVDGAGFERTGVQTILRFRLEN